MLKYKLDLESVPGDKDTHLAGIEGTFAEHISESGIVMMMLALDQKNSALGGFDEYGIIRLAAQSPGETVLDNTIRDVADLQRHIGAADFTNTRLRVGLIEAKLRYAHALLALEFLQPKTLTHIEDPHGKP